MAAAPGVRRSSERCLFFFFFFSVSVIFFAPPTFFIDHKARKSKKKSRRFILPFYSSVLFCHLFASEFHPRVPLRSLPTRLSISIDQGDGTFLSRAEERRRGRSEDDDARDRPLSRLGCDHLSPPPLSFLPLGNDAHKSKRSHAALATSRNRLRADRNLGRRERERERERA